MGGGEISTIYKNIEDKDKIYVRLIQNVGKEVEVELTTGETIYGVLDGFRWTPLVLSVDTKFDSKFLVNFRYVTKVRLINEK